MGKIGVIIVTYNAMKWIRACLDSLKNQTYSDYTVYVIDNNSADETSKVVTKDYPWVSFIENDENKGFAGGNNVVIKKALEEGCQYVVLLNQDTIVEENFIEAGVEMLQPKNVGFVSPKLLYKENRETWWVGSKVYRGMELLKRPLFQVAEHVSKKVKDEGQFEGVYETDYIPGTSLFTKREVLEKIGLLDEDFFMYSEDLDWSLRAKAAGYILLYFSSTTVLHDTPYGKVAGRPHISRLWFKYSNYFKGVHLIVKKHFSLSEKIIWYIKLPVTLFLTFLYEII